MTRPILLACLVLLPLAAPAQTPPDPGAAPPALTRPRGPDPGAMPAAPVVTLDEGLNDYPTLARADYIFGCLAANGQDRDTMRRCACSIDVIASILPYEAYERAETVLSMRLGTGERASLFRIPATETGVADLRRAQAEAEMVCF